MGKLIYPECILLEFFVKFFLDVVLSLVLLNSSFPVIKQIKVTGLRHHESKFPDSCNLENVHEWIYVIFLDQVQILYLDLLLFKEISNDLDQLLVALLFLPQALFYLKV